MEKSSKVAINKLYFSYCTFQNKRYGTMQNEVIADFAELLTKALSTNPWGPTKFPGVYASGVDVILGPPTIHR